MVKLAVWKLTNNYKIVLKYMKKFNPYAVKLKFILLILKVLKTKFQSITKMTNK